MQALEGMGFHFTLDGEQIRWRYAGTPPEGAETILHRLDREEVRRVLLDRQRGYRTVKPQVVVAPWPERYAYLAAIKAALDAGELADVQVTYIRRTRECVYHLMPPGLELARWLPNGA